MLDQSQHSTDSKKEETQLPESGSKPRNSQRKVNVFEYNNLASNNKKLKLINFSKPLQRTDIIHLESSLDFDKSTPAQSRNPGKSTVVPTHKFKKDIKHINNLSKKVSLKSLKMSEHDDRKTFISSTERHMDLTNNKLDIQKAQISTDAGIIITKRSEGQRTIKKRKKIVLENKLTSRGVPKERFISHERKNTEISANKFTPMPLYMAKDSLN